MHESCVADDAGDAPLSEGNGGNNAGVAERKAAGVDARG